MANKLDVIIFGATGFTGEFVVEKAVEYCKDLQWGIAGRNQGRLEKVLKEVGTKVGKDLSKTTIIIADVGDENSVKSMAESCRVVVNCCGPYHLYGEVVVKACIEAGTHHLDISGEPEFISKMQLLYNDLANEKGSYVVSACGFESIPSELAVNYMEQKFPGILNSVELFWESSIQFPDAKNRTLLNSGTWHSAILAMARNINWLKADAKLNSSRMPSLRPKLKPSLLPTKQAFSDKYFLYTPLTDRAVVRRSQRVAYELDGKRPVQFEMYTGFQSRITAFLLPLYMIFLTIMSLFSFTRNLLLKHVKCFSWGLMSTEGPTEGNMKNLHSTMYVRALGWPKGQNLKTSPNVELLGRLKATDPFYGLAAVCILSAAKIILRENQKMPKNGGVLTPGVAFAKTSLIEEVSAHKDGIKFEILQ